MPWPPRTVQGQTPCGKCLMFSDGAGWGAVDDDGDDYGLRCGRLPSFAVLQAKGVREKTMAGIDFDNLNRLALEYSANVIVLTRSKQMRVECYSSVRL